MNQYRLKEPFANSAIDLPVGGVQTNEGIFADELKMRTGGCETLPIEQGVLTVVVILTLLTGSVGRDIWCRAVILLVCADTLMAMLAIVQPLQRHIGTILPICLAIPNGAKKKPGGMNHRALLLRPQPPGIRVN